MLHPVMTIRPDGVIRSGILQPYGVRHVSPATRAHHVIDRFSHAIRPGGSDYISDTGNGLGVVTFDPAYPLHGGLGAEGDNDMMIKLAFGAGGLALGFLGCWLLVGRRRGRR